MVLNEPETSLQPDLLPAPGRLIARTAGRSQVIVDSHAPKLIGDLSKNPSCRLIQLEKTFGETTLSVASGGAAMSWYWPAR